MGVADCFRRDETLTFIGPDARPHAFRGVRWLPAPLHLAPSFARLSYLSWTERVAIGRALLRLAWLPAVDDDRAPTVGQWLRNEGQSDRAIERFWSVVLTSTLGEELDRASLVAARKVFVDGFLAAREAYVLHVPRVPLNTIYDRVASKLTAAGAELHLGAPIERVTRQDRLTIVSDRGDSKHFDFVVLAVPWTRIAALVDGEISRHWPWLDGLSQIESSPITGVHLWFDRPVMPYRHAVLVGRTSQWIFDRADSCHSGGQEGHYYQVVISASRGLSGGDRNELIQTVCDELAEIWPAAGQAKLVRSRVVNQPMAVFSVRPGLDRLRPTQRTADEQVMVAGDWTATGWPATMEGAVRSGYLAAEQVLQVIGRPQRFVAEPPSRGWLARWLIGDSIWRRPALRSLASSFAT
jgi:squalene-associated FAD-dependent desaturase